MKVTNNIVIGAGISGLLAAYYLAKAGHNVTVIEQESYPAMRTSFANGGQVSVSNSEVWTTWSNIGKGLKWLLRKDAPLLIRPTLNFRQWRWLAAFIGNTIRGTYEKNTADTIKLGIDSRELYQQLLEEEKLEFDQSYCGILHIYKDEQYLKNADQAKKIYNDNGCEWDMLSPEEIRNTWPVLEEINDIIGGAWTASDWIGDIHKFCKALAHLLNKKYHVEFIYDVHVGRCEIDDMLKEFDNIIVSAGVGSVKIAKLLGDDLPIYPVKGYSITITVRDEDLKYMPRVSILDDQTKIVASTLGNRLRVAGTAELSGENYDIRRDRIEPLLNWVKENFPDIDTSNYSSWACLRPMTPNMMPIVKRGRKAGVYYHTGHGHLGWTISPATAQQLVQLIDKDYTICS